MKLLIHRNLREPQEIEATRVVVLDQYDNPVALAVEVESGIIIADTAREDNEIEFNQLLQSLGINKTVIVTDAKQRPLREIHIPSV